MSESKLQSACFKYFNYAYPQFRGLYFAIPNGGSRHALEAVNLKRQGVVAGIPDTFLAVSRKNQHGLWIEFKYGKNRLSANQKTILDKLIKQGYHTAVVFTFDEFVQTIKHYLDEY